MTTDTRPKRRSTRGAGAAAAFSVTGIAKGSGMIRPDLATMLAYVATDAAVAPAALAALTRRAADQSFNRITVDGDTSTNDAFALIASGAADGAPIEDSGDPRFAPLLAAVTAVCRGLAEDIVRDGEGATKFIVVRVAGGRDEAACLAVAHAVAGSPLVKTALFASDANWGRILAAIGRAEVADLAIEDVALAIGGYPIVRAGEPVPDYEEARAAAIMRERDIVIDIVIGHGPAAAEVWTCDLTYDYVRINAAYRS
jgi:glutamate N-acetyltransferase/amino-acid N-acetyltransferase